MLFDLQSRRRRTAVKIIYLLLAVLMAGGLVLFGVGAGNGNGGFLNSLTGGSSNSTSSSIPAAVTKELKTAQKQVTASPDSASAWANLMEARWRVAGSGKNYNSNLEEYTKSGVTELGQVLTAWDKYSSLAKGKATETASLEAATAYIFTGNYTGASTAWQAFIAAEPNEVKGYECLSLSAYAAKQKNIGQQAATKALALTPKIDRLTSKSLYTAAGSSQTTAEQDVDEYCA